MKNIKKLFILSLVLVLSFVNCVDKGKKEEEASLERTIQLMLLYSMQMNASCVNQEPYHYFGTKEDVDFVNKFVLFGSSDGSCWSRAKEEFLSFPVTFAASGNNIYVVSGGSAIYYTTDGLNYTNATHPAISSNSIKGIYFINNSFYAATNDTSVKMLKSTDGITWTTPSLTNLTLGYTNTITGYSSGGTNYLIAMDDNFCDVLNTSTDGGNNWTQPGFCFWPGGAIDSSMSGNSIAIGFDSDGQMLKSTDHGSSFTQSNPLTSLDSSPENVKSIGYFDSNFWITLYNREADEYILARSADGSSWTEIVRYGGNNETYADASFEAFNSIVEGANGRLVANGAYSDDNGATWTENSGARIEGITTSGVYWPLGEIFYKP